MKNIALLVSLAQQNRIFDEKYYEALRKFGHIRLYDQDNFEDVEHVKAFLSGADIIVTSWGSPMLTAEYLDMCPNVKLVLHAAGTVKPIVDQAEFLRRGIRVTNAAMAIGQGVAETALGFAISACKGFYQLSQSTQMGEWYEKRQTVKDFYDITIGVISAGFVGRHFIKLIQNFQVDVLLYDPYITAEDALALGAKKVELDELLRCSDVVSVHAPSIPATDNMLSKEKLQLIRDGAVLINTARGSVIDETALIDELKTGRFFACIDVTNPEPPIKENQLRTLPNVVLTPHIAGAVTNGLKRIAKHICQEVERFEADGSLSTEVDLQKLSTLA